MKNLLLGLIAIVSFSLSSNAQGKELEFIYGSVITTFNQERIEYKFKSLGELDENIQEITKELDFDSLEKEKTCEIEMEIKIELTFGVTKILISETVNTSCDKETLSVAINRLKSMALATRS